MNADERPQCDPKAPHTQRAYYSRKDERCGQAVAVHPVETQVVVRDRKPQDTRHEIRHQPKAIEIRSKAGEDYKFLVTPARLEPLQTHPSDQKMRDRAH